MSVAVRTARAADAEAIATSWRTLLELHAGIDAAFAVRESAADGLADEFRRAIARNAGRVWVAEEAGRFAGFCAAHVEPAPPALAERSRCVITELAVEPSARRRGVGRALAEAALAWARERGAARVEVRVAARNSEAQAFWRALGFGDFVDVLDRRL